MEELEAAAKFFQNKDLNGDGKGDIYGFVSRGFGWQTTATSAAYIWNFGGSWIKDDGRTANLSNPGTVAGIEFYGKLMREYGPPSPLSIKHTDAMRIFKAGKAAMHSGLNSWIYLHEDPKKSRVVGNTGCTLVPKGPENFVVNMPTQSFCISSYSKNKKAAWLWIVYALNKENCLRLLKWGLPVTRKSSWTNKDFVPINNNTEWVKVSLEGQARGIDIAKPHMVAVNEGRDVIGQILAAAIKGEDVKAQAPKFNKMLQDLLDKEPPYVMPK